jgi:O-antigen ligase
VPAAIFVDSRDLLRFLRRLLVPLLVGCVLFCAVQMLSLTGTPRAFGLDLTNPTVTAAAAAGLIFVLLDPRPLDVAKGLVLLLLAATVVIGLARSVWVGCVLAALALWLIGRADRTRLTRGAVVLAYALVLAASLSAASNARPYRVLESEVSSLLFHSSDASVDNPVGNAKWRLTAWQETLDGRVQDNPVLGEGFGRPALDGTSVTRADQRVQLHNGYLTYLLREGIVGLALFLFLTTTALVRCARAAQGSRDPAVRGVSLAVLGSIVVYLGNIGFAVIVEGPMGGIPFWLLVGMGLAMPRLAVRGSSDVGGRPAESLERGG